MTQGALPDRVAALLGDHLRAEADEGRITMLGSTGWAFDVLVPSDWKETVAATLEVGERSLRAEAFFLRAPEEADGAAYRVLLERNLRPGPWRFAASDTGDVWLVAEVPLEAVDDGGGRPVARRAGDAHRRDVQAVLPPGVRHVAGRAGRARRPGARRAPPVGARLDHDAGGPLSAKRFCHFEFAGVSTALTCENDCPPGLLSP